MDEPPFDRLTPLHHAAHKLYALHQTGQGKPTLDWLSLTIGHQNILIHNLIDFINKHQKPDPPLTLQTADSYPFSTTVHTEWKKQELAKWKKQQKSKGK